MYRVGEREVEAIRKVLLSGEIFRYNSRIGACRRFETRLARTMGVKHAYMTASGTNALSAALIGLQIGPGDEVLVPACTYMATAVAVLAAGAIPVIVDIDDSITIDPDAIDAAVGPRTRAVIPVHMWGLSCDMRPVMRVARKHKLLVIEDVAQAVGGAYRGRMLGSFGDAAMYSFNYYKHITSGEGGAVVTNKAKVIERARCYTDCTSFYWQGRDEYTDHFVSSSARATEIAGAMLNVQLDRLPGMIRATRREKQRILRETANTGLAPTPAHDLDGECGESVMYKLPSPEQADRFAVLAGGTVTAKTGRHVYTEWTPILENKGAHHPALNPFLLKENKPCRRKFTPDMCTRSLEILSRTVMIKTHPDHKRGDVTEIIRKIHAAAKDVL